MKISQIEESNWEEILEIQNQAYQEVEPEKLEVLKSKWVVSPETCLVSLSPQGKVLGYVLAHPWNDVKPPKLFEALTNVKAGANLYLHDMAVSSEAKGNGLGGKMTKKLFEVARQKGFRSIRLVAIQGAESFWALHDFEAVSDQEVCSTYGDDAVLMEKILFTP